MNQTKLESAIERFVDMATGFIISVIVYKYYIFESTVPVTPIEATTLFTVISFFRGYVWRRFFNRGLHKAVHKLVVRYYNGNR